jgi:hypothetical protein
MKQFQNFYGWGMALLFASLFLFAGRPMVSAPDAAYDGSEAEYEAPVTGAKTYGGSIVVVDTITDTEVDVISISEALLSLYSYDIGMTLNNLSGTRSVKLVLQRSNAASGSTDWLGVDSVTATGSTVNNWNVDGSEFWGRRARILVSGTTGTMSVRYTIRPFFKKKN